VQAEYRWPGERLGTAVAGLPRAATGTVDPLQRVSPHGAIAEPLPPPVPRPSTATAAAPARPGRTVVPVVAEALAAGRRRVPSGRLRVRKAARRVVVDEPLVREETRVERIAVNRPIEAPAGHPTRGGHPW
jgi:hypothetical protein